ncbi:MAG: GTA-gp10 family protein [Bryobacteraceae bacterium]
MKFASPDIQFDLDGRPYTLRFSAKALAALQDYWQLENLSAVNAKLLEIDNGGLAVADLAALLWAGLRTHHPDVTIEKADDLLDSIGIANFERLLGAAISGASGGGETAPANPPKRKRSPGR